MKEDKSIHNRSLLHNSIVNIIGQNFPILVGILVIPLLIKGLGTERFGLLTLVWVVIGYCNLFDFGLGRALTKAISDRHGRNHCDDITELIWTTLCVMFVVGAAVAAFMLLLGPTIVNRILHVTPALQYEATVSVYIMATTIPVVITTAGLVGVLQAYQRFDLLNAIRIPMGTLSYLGPCVVLYFYNSLVAVVVVTTMVRYLNFVIHVWCCRKTLGISGKFRFKFQVFRPLIKQGSWMTVSNIISPLMLYFDRIVLSAIVSAGVIAYYSTPYEIITKFLQIPLAIVTVLFPQFSYTYAVNPDETSQLFQKSMKYIVIAAFPILATAACFSYEGIKLWIDSDFAAKSYSVMQILAIGVFLNALAFVPATLLQGIGRPDLNAKMHLLELPLYFFLLIYLVNMFGYVGAALAWTIRVGLDLISLMLLSLHVLPANKGQWKTITLISIAVICLLFIAFSGQSVLRVYVYIATAIGYLLFLINDPDIRKHIQIVKSRVAYKASI